MTSTDPLHPLGGDDRIIRATAQEIEDKLRESQDRLARIVDSAMDAIVAIDDDQRIVVFNPAAEKMFRCAASDAIGTSLERFIPAHFRSVHRAHFFEFRDASVTNRTTGFYSPAWAQRADGEEFPIEASIFKSGGDGKRLFVAFVRDITERKRADAILRESEERFRSMADAAPVMIWMSGPDGLSTYSNRRLLEFTGRPIEAQLGNGWAESVHPDDITRCLETYTQAFDKRLPFKLEYRIRRHDGAYRWVLVSGAPIFPPDGHFAGYVGSAIDITDQKLAAEALSNLSRNLMEAQEKERAWIARELHDDFAQRVVGLALQLHSCAQALPSGTSERVRVQKTSDQANALARDIQAVSHRLHSTQLEHLGLASAAADLCQELSEQHHVEIDVSHSGVSENVSKDIAICLFRVLQEALNNAIRHAGVRHFRVTLRGTPTEIQLEVIDAGRGFDPKAVIGHGLGLIGMQERLSLVKGNVFIESRPGGGTTIRARVNLGPAENHAL